MQNKKIRKYTIKFESDSEGGYIVRVPAFPEIVTGGRNLSEAEHMTQDAILCCEEYYVEQGRPLPRDVDYKATEEPKFFKLAMEGVR